MPLQIIASVTNTDLRLAAVLMRNFDVANGTSSTLLLSSTTNDVPRQQVDQKGACCSICKSAGRHLSIGRRHNLPALEANGEASASTSQGHVLETEVRCDLVVSSRGRGRTRS